MRLDQVHKGSERSLRDLLLGMVGSEMRAKRGSEQKAETGGLWSRPYSSGILCNAFTLSHSASSPKWQWD